MIEDKTGRPAPANAAGLFHAALLLPDRAALGNWLRRVAEKGVRFEGFSDHGVSEALYLSDPDGNGLEFYSDRPREAWPRGKNGTDLAMYTRPLDLDSLVAAGAAGPRRRVADRRALGSSPPERDEPRSQRDVL